MKQKLKVSVSKEPQTTGFVTCRNRGIREKLLMLLFGEKKRVTVLIPGDSVQELAICEVRDGGKENDGRTQTESL